MTYRAAVITVSDGCYSGHREDKSGALLVDELKKAGFEVSSSVIVPDEHDQIVVLLKKYLSEPIHLILTTGGTGFGPRDVTPEATREILERDAPGLAEILRLEGASQTPLSWLSRGIAGVADGKLIINLPGSTRAVSHSMMVLKPLLFHALDLLNGEKPH